MKATLAGHPLHPQLIGLPVALFPISLIFDIMHWVTGNRSYGDTAYRTMLAGYLGGAAAAAAGAVDSLAIPTGTETKRTANTHLLLNVGAVIMYGLNLLMRRDHRGRRPLLAPFLMSVVGNLVLYVSGWLGGHLVYHHRMRVRGVSPIESAADLKPPGDAAIEQALHKVALMTPGQISEEEHPAEAQRPALAEQQREPRRRAA